MTNQPHDQLENELSNLYQNSPSTQFVTQLEQRLAAQAREMAATPAQPRWRSWLAGLMQPSAPRMALALGAAALVLIPLIILYSVQTQSGIEAFPTAEPVIVPDQLTPEAEQPDSDVPDIPNVQPSEYDTLAYVPEIGFVIADNAVRLTAPQTVTVDLRDYGIIGLPPQGTLIVHAGIINEQSAEFVVELNFNLTERISQNALREGMYDNHYELTHGELKSEISNKQTYLRFQNGMTQTLRAGTPEGCKSRREFVQTDGKTQAWCEAVTLQAQQPFKTIPARAELVVPSVDEMYSADGPWVIPLDFTQLIPDATIQQFSTADRPIEAPSVNTTEQGIGVELVAVHYGDEHTSVLVNLNAADKYNFLRMSPRGSQANFVLQTSQLSVVQGSSIINSASDGRLVIEERSRLQYPEHQQPEDRRFRAIDGSFISPASTSPLMYGYQYEISFPNVEDSLDFELMLSPLNIHLVPPNEGLVAIELDLDLNTQGAYIPIDRTIHYGDIAVEIHGVQMGDRPALFSSQNTEVDYTVTLPPSAGEQWNGIFVNDVQRDCDPSTPELDLELDGVRCYELQFIANRVGFDETWTLSWDR